MPVRILIESAECTVPRRGTQERRRKQKDELRKSDPAMAARILAIPSYVDPDAASDDFAQFEFGWNSEVDGISRGCYSFMPIHLMAVVKPFALGEVKVHGVSGVDDEEWWIDYSFHLKASYALEMLKTLDKVPCDAILAPTNEDDRPIDYEDDEEGDPENG